MLYNGDNELSTEVRCEFWFSDKYKEIPVKAREQLLEFIRKDKPLGYCYLKHNLFKSRNNKNWFILVVSRPYLLIQFGKIVRDIEKELNIV